jgi:hypothetical protein
MKKRLWIWGVLLFIGFASVSCVLLDELLEGATRKAPDESYYGEYFYDSQLETELDKTNE